MTNPITLLTDWWARRKRQAHLASLPHTLDGTIAHLIEHADPATLARFAAASERDCHYQLPLFTDMGLRNGFGLWDRDQPLTRWFREQGIWMADDMSAILIRALWLALQTPSRRVDMAVERAYYDRYWAFKGVGFDGVPIPGHPGEPRSSRVVTGPDGRIYLEAVEDGR